MMYSLAMETRSPIPYADRMSLCPCVVSIKGASSLVWCEENLCPHLTYLAFGVLYITVELTQSFIMFGQEPPDEGRAQPINDAVARVAEIKSFFCNW